jgi:hypothetical protein
LVTHVFALGVEEGSALALVGTSMNPMLTAATRRIATRIVVILPAGVPRLRVVALDEAIGITFIKPGFNLGIPDFAFI